MPKNVFYDMILDDEQITFVNAIKDQKKTIIFCDAPAGTGKTTLAMGAANILYHDKRNELDGIVYIVSPYGEQKQGYLPGSITEKSEVYYEPAYQAMIEVGMNPNSDVCSESMTAKKKGEAYVKLLTHTYLRGTNLQNKVVILDETQNYTVAELKKVLTRCHDSCKVIVIGHTGQIDIRGGSDLPVIIHGRTSECLQVMGVSRATFYCYVTHTRNGTRKCKYEIFVDEEDE